MSGMRSRAFATTIIWLAYTGIIIYALDAIGVWTSLLAFILMIPVIVSMGAIWGMFAHRDSSEHREAESTLEKRKRERIDSVLRDLSDEDLESLRQRLKSGSIDDEILYDRMVGDDGELVDRY